MTITNKVAGKLVVAFVAATMLFTLAFAPMARAATNEELEAQIAKLLADIAALQGQTSSSSSQSYTFTSDLTVGSTGESVKQLQMYLNNKGYAVASTGVGSKGMESMYFGMLTKAALARYQAAMGISPAVGYFGPITRAKVNADMVVVVTPPSDDDDDDDDDTANDDDDDDDDDDLSGDSGSIDSYELSSGYSNEEVGEDEEDVIVAGLDIENSDGSDIEITAVRLVFDEGTANRDFDKYASEVSIWLDDEEVGRVDADAFTDDNNWTKTITLDGAILDMEETGSLFAAVSGVSSLDTNDAGETWTIDFTSVRFRDAEGSTISEDPTVGATTFSFETFAASANTELHITEGDDDAEEINDAHIINVHATDDTDDVEVLAFNIEIEGDSDVNIDALPITITTAEAANGTFDDPDDVIDSVDLYADGEKIGSEVLSTADANGDTEVVLFDDLDFDIEAGSDVDFVVKADVVDLADDLDVGDTIQVTFGETETDLATFEAEDESGEELVDADKIGTITGGTHEVRDVFPQIALVGTPTAVKTSGDSGATANARSDIGTFTITFDVTGVDGDVFIDESAPAEGAGTDETDLNIDGVATFTNSITSIAGGANGLAEDVTNSFRVDEDETNRFQIVVDIRDTAGTDMVDGFFDVSIVSILYALTDVDGDLLYTSDMDRFQTPAVYLDDLD
ncbi:peptidoglycan-binding protein [Candidatus Kaiserbacteria bacterium]|nr:peptidoglycan-binding protein [Candidatus Kaiserbacteria bacterium]